MDAPLLTTKLNAPPVRPGLVPRPRLVALLTNGLAHRLTLISAPAGCGKTTLVAAWLAGLQKPCAWLSLDEQDNDPARFLAYLVAALQRVDGRIGRSVEAMLRAPQSPPPEVPLTALINDVAALSPSCILAIDDYHVIHDLPIHQQLAFLLEHQPSNMHLIVATREDPPLALSRLRARAQILEIRHPDLKFTKEEAAEFFRSTMGLELSDANVAALYQRTEGWIAGLQLVALSIRRTEDVDRLVRSFASSNRYVLDYMMEEVFERQSPDIQDFFLKTCVLDRLSASLCDAVVERDDSLRVLLELEQANLFLVSLDESRQWYRYHRLFADLLLHRLEAKSPEIVPSLHRRASQWYEDAGLVGDAVHHALAGTDWERAARLIQVGNEALLKRGETATLMRWYQALPEQELGHRPRLCLDYAWVLILTGQLDAAESYLERTRGITRDTPALLGAVLAAQAHIARARGDDARVIALSDRALALLPDDDHNGRSVVMVNLGIARWNSGDLSQAERALTGADVAAKESDNHYARLVALGFLGTIRATWGRLGEAAALYEQAIHYGGRLPPVALAQNELGALRYEWNDLEGAAEHLERGIELGQRGGNAEIQGGNHRIMALLRQAKGDAAGAWNALERAHRLDREHRLSPQQRARNAACHVQIALAQDDLPTAIQWAGRVTEDADAWPFYPRLGLTRARLLIAQGRKTEAAGQLASGSQMAAREGWQYGLVVVRAMQCLAAAGSEEALGYLQDGLQLAEPEGYIRTFVDLGEPMADLLSAFITRGPVRPSLQVYAERLLRAFSSASSVHRHSHQPALPKGVQHRSLIEPLSERELDVLRQLVGAQTNQEIARELHISINTVKTHLKSIYGKLNVSNRRRAAKRARELDLIP